MIVSSFVASVPCEASELVHFRKRIGEEGIELILKESIRMNGDDAAAIISGIVLNGPFMKKLNFGTIRYDGSHKAA